MNLRVGDISDCSKLYSNIETMKNDYDNWKNVLKKTHLKVQTEIKLWERAIEKVRETIRANSLGTTFDVKNNENDIFVTITFTPTQSKCIKINDGYHLRDFTLPGGLEWIQKIIADLNESLTKIDLDQNYVSTQQEKLYSTEKYLMNGGKAHTQNAIGTVGQTKVNGNVEKKPEDLTALMNHRKSEFEEFMLRAEEDSALINNLTDEVLVMLNKLTSINSKMLTDSIVDGIKNEIDELLERFGEENITAETAKLSINNQRSPTKIAPTKYISKKISQTKHYFKDMEIVQKLFPTVDTHISEPVLVDLMDIRKIKIKLIEYESNRNSGTENGLAKNQVSLSDLSDIHLSDNFSDQIISNERVTNIIGSHVSVSDNINPSGNYSLHINFAINPAHEITISKIDLERKENDFVSEETQPIKIRAETESGDNRVNSKQNSNRTQTYVKCTKSLKCDVKASLDRSTSEAQKKSAADIMMKYNESSVGMCKSKCKNDAVSRPPFNDISKIKSDVDLYIDEIRNILRSGSFDSTEAESPTDVDVNNIDPTKKQSNKFKFLQNVNDNMSIYKLPDLLRDRKLENTVNEEICAERSNHILKKNCNFNVEIESGKEKIKSSISGRNFTVITVQVCNDGKNPDDSFDKSETDDKKSKITKNKTFSVQDIMT
ncbi:uncharacterized protein LOC6529434 [Drosophila yakuba]|uniref:Uncharacterized protein n=1 Tax=Drosophila yakuba TaxID=7245 RepID=B4P8P2_DROYA|nr:uncharacterized protein LOC6529434 [Drosophila yakuba]EDW90150.1 uncharacterized protein Dyak_GE18102 [Drosophila yakuba]